ncbi:hypothetical protein EV580_1365 [Mycobacterium sp. BK086]|nr:hypothetical protein EV580_1365 [Mycobacterium sp. BK086]
MSADLTLPDARAERDALAGRTDVLDKVGVLRCLPDDMHATTEMVAEFYETSVEAIRQAVKRNRDELDDDGYQVLGRLEVSDKLSLTPDELGMPRNAGSIGLYPRRAVLRLGMVLRDSPVARQTRDYLLDAEQVSPVRELTEDEKLFEAFQILRTRTERLAMENQQQADKIALDAPRSITSRSTSPTPTASKSAPSPRTTTLVKSGCGTSLSTRDGSTSKRSVATRNRRAASKSADATRPTRTNVRTSSRSRRTKHPDSRVRSCTP